MDILFREEVFAMIGCAIEVHRTLGAGFLTNVHADALAMELRRKGIPFERERRFPVTDKGIRLDRDTLRILCCSQIVLELKALHFPSRREEAQLLNYLNCGTTLEVID